MTQAMDPAAVTRRGVWRSRIGLIAVGMLLGNLAICTLEEVLGRYEPSVRLNVDGRDVSKHGGAKVKVLNERGLFAQTCNGECDNILFEADSGDNVYSVSVLDSRGQCILCDDGQYVTSGLLTDWTLGGRDKLTLTEKPYKPYGKGS